MKIIISETQYERLFEQEQEVLHIPDLNYVGGWDILQKILKVKGNPPYSIGGDLDLVGTKIKSLGNLQSVDGWLDLSGTKIKSLGNLKFVGVDLYLGGTPIESLGNLQSVGRNLDLRGTPISKMYSEKQIRQMGNVKGEIYL